jgi:hypothetical protein
MRNLIIVSLALLLSCKRESISEPDLTRVLSAYSLEKVNHPLPVLNGRIYEQVKQKLDFNKVTVYQDEAKTLTFLIPFKGESKIYAVKENSEVLYSGQMQDERNGSFGILKGDEAITITFVDGKRTIAELSVSDYRFHFAGFCQRGPKQKFKDCYNHEVDEFCDSFVSCVVLATQPQVSVLIALACSCNA